MRSERQRARGAVTEWALLRPLLPIAANDRLHEKMLIVDGKEAADGRQELFHNICDSAAVEQLKQGMEEDFASVASADILVEPLL